MFERTWDVAVSLCNKGRVDGRHFSIGVSVEAASPALIEKTRAVTTDGEGRYNIVDLRPGSSSFGRWQAFELTAENRRQLYVPAGFAHGLQTLRDETEVGYLISQFHNPAAADGLRHDDPILAIEWPLSVTAISVRDQSWPDFAAVRPDLAAGALPRSAPAVSGTLSTRP